MLKRILELFQKKEKPIKKPEMVVPEPSPETSVVLLEKNIKKPVKRKPRIRKTLSRKRLRKVVAVHVPQPPKEKQITVQAVNEVPMINSDISTEPELVDFVISLPSSSAKGSPLGKYAHQDQYLDYRIADVFDRKEALYLFNKYKMTQADRKRMIAAILNAKLLTQ